MSGLFGGGKDNSFTPAPAPIQAATTAPIQAATILSSEDGVVKEAAKSDITKKQKKVLLSDEQGTTNSLLG